MEQLQVVRLDHKPDFLAGGLPIGERKKLEVARVLATKPELLLLDEVMGGLNPAESEEIIQLILEIKKRGLTQMVIEHDMKAIMRISDRIVVLNSGEKLAEGAPAGDRRQPGGDRPPTWASGSSDGAACSRSSKLNFSYGDLQVLWDVDLEVKQGEIVTVVGANGAGKSTTLKNVSRLVRPTSGSITFEGHDLSARAVPRGGGAGHRPGAGGAPDLPGDDGAREPAHGLVREVHAQGPGAQHGARLLALPAPRRAQEPAGRHHVRRRAADAGHRPRAHDQPTLLLLDEPSLGLSPLLVQQHLRDHQGDQPAGDHRSCSSSRTCTSRCASPTGPTCWRPDGWYSPAPGAELLDNEHVKKAFLGM